MNKILILSFASLVCFLSTAQDNSNAEIYTEAAQEMCNCVNLSTADLSERMKAIIVACEGNSQKFQEDIEAYAMEDPEGASRDSEVLNGPMLSDMSSCFDRVISDYEDIYTGDSEEEAAMKILEAMRSLDGCETSVGFFELGVAGDDDAEESAVQSNEIRSTSENTSLEDSEHAEVAGEVCNCINTSAQPLSNRMREIFSESEGDEGRLKELINVYVEEDLENAQNDAGLMQGQVAEDIEICMSRIQSEYEHLFSDLTEDQVLESLLDYLKEMPDCKFSVGVIQLGLSLE